MIKRRNVIMVPILFIITFGIYGLYWFYQTADEMIRHNKQENENPLVWLILALIPIVNLFAIWKHTQAVEQMSEKKVSGVVLFLLWLIFSPAALIWTQSELNKRAGEATAA